MAFPSYREHGVAWTRGIDPRGPARASSAAPTTARGTRPRTGSTTTRSSSATSASTPPATPWARSSSRKVGEGPDSEATICFFGDGATSQGDVHEGFVWAAVYDAPVVFYCQNNQFAISEPNDRQTRLPLYKRAAGYGFPGIRVDGNDVLACLAVTRWALEECRTGNGPVLIEAFTYRMDAHTTSDDPTRYRLAAELELWKLKDPIERVRVNLVREHGVGQEFFDDVQAESDALAERFRAALPEHAAAGTRSDVLPGLRGGLAQRRRPARGVPGVPLVVRGGVTWRS